MKTQKKWLISLLVLLVVTLSVAKGFLVTFAAGRGNLVVFSANWCASCREIVPVVRDVAGQNSLGVTEIDVDSQTAPKQAQSMGLSIPNEEPPQVFYVNRGHATLIYNGKGYKFGSGNVVRTTLLQNLQRVLQ
jgi:thiol-disulfide isomerase/thioredoxin